ncbi:hypothetical protein ACFLQ1_00885 [Candidatus Auribacterota bacterium]
MCDKYENHPNTKMLYKQIIENFIVLKEWEKRYFDSLKLSPLLKQPFLSGGKIKFILEDQYAQQWIFKNPYSNDFSAMGNIVAAGEIAFLFGINDYLINQTILEVNGRQLVGYVVPFFTLKNKGWNELMKEKTYEILQNIIFDWLIDKQETALHHLLFTDRNQFTNIDFLTSLCNLGKSTSLLASFRLLKNSPINLFGNYYLKDNVKLKENIPYNFLLYIQYFPEKILYHILNRHHVFPSAVNKFMNRKVKLIQKFDQFIIELTKQSGKKFPNLKIKNCFSYLYQINEKFNQKLLFYKNMSLEKKIKNTLKFNIITSWLHKKKLAWDGFPPKTYYEVLTVLPELIEEETNPYSKLGLYVIRLKIINFLKRYPKKGQNKFSLENKNFGIKLLPEQVDGKRLKELVEFSGISKEEKIIFLNLLVECGIKDNVTNLNASN